MKKFSPVKIKKFGEKAWLVSFEAVVSLDLLKNVKAYCQNLTEQFPKAIDVQNTYNSILISYSNLAKTEKQPTQDEVAEIIKNTKIPEKISTKRFELPVCYDQEFGIDLKELAEEKNLDPKKVIQKHIEGNYTVFFTGFLPGFLYLGGLDKHLYHPRKAEPRLKVKKGSVGIAGNQTGIYPQESAGGWQIIGNCPVNLFDSDKNPPVFCEPGDKLRFVPVSKTEHQKIKASVENNSYTLKSENYEF
jgi:inhibitor of KinA